MSSASFAPGTIVTPEAVVLEFSVGGLATRLFAKLIDLAMIAFLTNVAVFASLLIAGGSEAAVVGLVTVSVTVTIFVLPAVIEWFWNGRTPGKALLGLRVVTTEGGPISFRHAFVRNLIQLLELPTGIAMFVALSNPLSQRLGDLAAGTFVINQRRNLELLMVPTLFYPPVGLEALAASLDVGRVTSAQNLMIRNYLLRVRRIEPGARHDIAARIVAGLDGVVVPGCPDTLSPEYFLICVAAAYQDRSGTHAAQRVQPAWG